MQTEHFKLPPEFYVKCLRDYHNWKYAWCREQNQNLIDAGATTAHYYSEDIDDNLCKVTLVDNGKGMSVDVLRDAYMSLTGSVKDEGSVGGMGVASLMIVQAHHSFEIRSKDYICTGSRGSYQVEHTNKSIDGTIISVVFEKSSLGYGGISSFKDALKEWCRFTNNTKLKIYWNDEEVKIENPKYKYSFTTELGDISFSEREDGSNYTLVYVRIGRQPMFSLSFYSESDVFIGVIDLHGTSIDNLTSNRDSLIGDKRVKLQSIMQALSEESGRYKMGDMTTCVLNQVDYSIVSHTTDETEKSDSEVSSELDSVAKISLPNKSKPKSTDLDESIATVFRQKNEEQKSFIDKVNVKLSKINSSNLPDNTTIKIADLEKCEPREALKAVTNTANLLNQKRINRLTWTWKFTVNRILEALDGFAEYPIHLNQHTGEYEVYGEPIRVGLLFNTESVLALYTQQNGFITLSINVKYGIQSDYDIYDIQDAAIHEISHCMATSHNEYFVKVLEDIRRKFRRHYKSKSFKKDLALYLKANCK